MKIIEKHEQIQTQPRTQLPRNMQVQTIILTDFCNNQEAKTLLVNGKLSANETKKAKALRGGLFYVFC